MLLYWFMHVLSPSFYLMYVYKLYCCITVLLLYDKCLAYLCWLCDKFHICKDLRKVNKYDMIWYDMNQTYAMPPSCYFTFYNYIYSVNFYIHPRSSSTQDMYSEQYGSHLKLSHVLFFVIIECLELKFKVS
jgi:hypothetical protein